MSEQIKDGGPAFPVSADDDRSTHNDAPWGSVGITTRDYFAAKAMQGLLAQSMGTAGGSDPAFAAQYAYLVADAMLIAREAKS